MKADTVNVRVEMLREVWEHIKYDHRRLAHEFGGNDEIEDYLHFEDMWALKELRDILTKLENIEKRKQFGFEPEECPKCKGDRCDWCWDGVLTQKIVFGWAPPRLLPGQRLVAVDKGTAFWEFVGLADEEGNRISVSYDWPFQQWYASYKHFRELGFEIIGSDRVPIDGNDDKYLHEKL